MRELLLDQVDADGPSEPVTWIGGSTPWGTVAVWGVWDGAKVSLLFSPDDEATWLPVAPELFEVTSAAADAVEYAVGSHSYVKGFALGRYPLVAAISGAGDATVLSVEVRQ